MIAVPSTPISPFAPPSGMVTFLFTDIEGSTRLWERDRATMQVALERHTAILAATIRAHGGYHFKTIGDAFQAAFGDPVAASVDAQRALDAEPWPETGPLRVRMGLHRGEVEPSATHDYQARVLHRLRALLAAGHGGQVLLSAAVREAVGERLPDGVIALSLGTHRLRDLVAAQEIWQLVIPGVTTTFPLGDEAYERAWAAGRALSLDEAISEALEIAHQIAGRAETPARYSPGRRSAAATSQ